MTIHTVGCKLDNQYFVLASSDNYSVDWNGVTVFGLANQRQWSSVTGPRAAHQVQMLE